jgi:hypothetical protein
VCGSLPPTSWLRTGDDLRAYLAETGCLRMAQQRREGVLLLFGDGQLPRAGDRDGRGVNRVVSRTVMNAAGDEATATVRSRELAYIPLRRAW